MDQLVRWSRRVGSADEAAEAVTEAFASLHRGSPASRARRDPRRRARAALVRRAADCTKVPHPGRSGCGPPGGRGAGRRRPADDHCRRRGGRRAGRADRTGRGARGAGRHHCQRQGRGRRGAPAVGRRVDPAARRAEGRRGQRRAAGGRHRARRLGPVGGPDSRQDRDPLRHRPGPAGQELPGRPRAARRRRHHSRRASARPACGLAGDGTSGPRHCARRAATKPQRTRAPTPRSTPRCARRCRPTPC